MTTNPITPATVRHLALVKQGLHQRPSSADKDTLRAIIRRLNLLQLDSISVTARSHYLVMLARAGLYERGDLDALLPDRALFEQWAHAACLIPMEDYGYFAPRLAARRENPEGYTRRLLRATDDPEPLLERVRQTITEQGAMASRDFESPREGPGSWWNWKPAKIGLEYLYDLGELMVATRRNFHRYYDLTERVLAGIDYDTGLTLADYERFATVQGLRAQGIGTLAHLADYYRLHKTQAAAQLQALVESGEVLEIEVEGWQEVAYLHREDVTLMQQVMNGEHAPQLTVFLSPFDNLIWHRDRVEAVFDFYYRIEMYTPANKRQYGYYVLPILHRGRLVGRIDPKIERKEKVFRIRALYLEPGVAVDDALVAGLRGAIKEFAAFHDCASVAIGECEVADLKAALLAAPMV